MYYKHLIFLFMIIIICIYYIPTYEERKYQIKYLLYLHTYSKIIILTFFSKSIWILENGHKKYVHF